MNTEGSAGVFGIIVYYLPTDFLHLRKRDRILEEIAYKTGYISKCH